MLTTIGIALGGALIALALFIMLLGRGEQRKKPAAILAVLALAAFVLPALVAKVFPIALLVLVCYGLYRGFKTMRW